MMRNQVTPKDILSNNHLLLDLLLPYLTITDMHHLRMVCSATRVDLSRGFRYHVCNRISEIIQGDGEEFLRRVGTVGGIISGSIIVQVLLNERWKSDIDVYVPTTVDQSDGLLSQLLLDSRESYTQDFQAKLGSQPYIFMQRYPLKTGFYQNVSNYHLVFDYRKILCNRAARNFSKQIQLRFWRGVQVIVVDHAWCYSTHEAVTRNFDIDVLMNTWDEKAKTLTVHNFKKLQKKLGFALTNSLLHHRIEKYIERGFTLNLPQLCWEKFSRRRPNVHVDSVIHSTGRTIQKGIDLRKTPVCQKISFLSKRPILFEMSLKQDRR